MFCGPSMVFTNVINPRSAVSRKHEYQRTVVRRGATIGANATVVCGVTLGEYAFVGAGAVVTKDVKSFALVTGVPARQVGWMCRCGEKLGGTGNREPGTEAPGSDGSPFPVPSSLICSVCGTKYDLHDGTLRLAETP